MNIALSLAYDGTDFHGWQRQKNDPSIQQTLEEAMGKLCGQAVTFSGVGRTDAGVHARHYVANCKACCTVPMDRLPLALGALLPPSIVVYGATIVPDDFDARFACTKKEYAYHIYPSRIGNPFTYRTAYRVPYPLDIDAMRAGAAQFVGRHDFAAVRSVGTPVSSTVRTIFWCEVDEAPLGMLRVRVCGDGFLYNMVRAIAGTLLYVGAGKIAPSEIAEILKQGERANAGPTLPACGLFLNRLWYDGVPELDAFGLHRLEDTP